MKMNIKESLIRIDRDTDFKHSLTDLYEACRLDEDKKRELVQYIEDRDIPRMSSMLSNEAGVMTENVSDDISDEDMPKDLSLEEYFDDNYLSRAIDDTMHCGKLLYAKWTDNHLVKYLGNNSYEVEHKGNGAKVIVEFDVSDQSDSTLRFTIDGKNFVARYPNEAQDIIIGELENKNFKQFDIDLDESFRVGDAVFVKPCNKSGRVVAVNGDYIDVEIFGGNDPDRRDTFYPEDLEFQFSDDLDEDLLNEGPGAVLGDLAGRAVGDAWKGIKNFAKGVAATGKDVGKTVKAVAKSAHTDWKQSKTRAKVVDAARSIKDAENVDDFKAKYKKRQDDRKLSDKARTQSYKGKLGKSIGDMQDWKFEVNGKKMNYDQFMKLPQKDRAQMIKNNTVKCTDLMGRPITVQDQAKRLSGLKVERLIMETFAHFDFKSGANPYIAFDDVEAARMLRKYKGRVTNKDGKFYTIDDTDENEDKFSVDMSLTERVGPNHSEEDAIEAALMNIPGTTKVEFDWSNGDVYRVPENHLIILPFCRDGFDDPYFENRYKWKRAVMSTLRKMGWTLEDPIEDNDTYLYLVMQKAALTEATAVLDRPKISNVHTHRGSLSSIIDSHMDEINDMINANVPASHIVHCLRDWVSDADLTKANAKYAQNAIMRMSKMRTAEEVGMYLYNIRLKAEDDSFGSIDSQFYVKRHKYEDLNEELLRESSDEVGMRYDLSDLRIMAKEAYDKDDSEFWHHLTDEELRVLWKGCQITKDNPWGAAYDDEVHDEMYSRGLFSKNESYKLHLRESMDEEEDKPFTHTQIFDELKRETSNFSIGTDRGIYSFEKEVKMAEKILKKHYNNVKVTEHGNDFMVEFSEPKNKKKKVNESKSINTYNVTFYMDSLDDNMMSGPTTTKKIQATSEEEAKKKLMDSSTDKYYIPTVTKVEQINESKYIKEEIGDNYSNNIEYCPGCGEYLDGSDISDERDNSVRYTCYHCGNSFDRTKYYNESKSIYEDGAESLKDNSVVTHWTQAYAKFMEVIETVDIYDTEAVQDAVEKLYNQHKGEPAWDNAWLRWLEPSAEPEDPEYEEQDKLWKSERDRIGGYLVSSAANKSKSIKEDLSSITSLADDCGENTFKKSARDVRFTFEDEKSASEFMNKLKEKNIHYDELSKGVIKVSKASVLDESLTEQMTYTDTNGFLGEPGEKYTMSQFRRMWQDKDNDPSMSAFDSFEAWVGETISQMDAHEEEPEVAPSGRGKLSTATFIDKSGIMGEAGAKYIVNDLADYWEANRGSDPVLANYNGDWKKWLDDTIEQMEIEYDSCLFEESLTESKSELDKLNTILAAQGDELRRLKKDGASQSEIDKIIKDLEDTKKKNCSTM